MHFLLISLLCNLGVTVLLRLSRDRAVEIRTAIAANYAVAALLSYFFGLPNGAFSDYRLQDIWTVILALMFLMPAVFVVVFETIAKHGVAKFDAAQRLSLIIPIISAFFIFNEAASKPKIIGIALAFAALLMLLHRKNSSQNAPRWTLLTVWAGYGIIDVLFKVVATGGNNGAATMLIVFIGALLLMIGYLLVRKIRIDGASIAVGVLLGALNFANIISYIAAHKFYRNDPTLVFAGMNIGVICGGTLLGVALFKERLTRVNLLGLAAGVLAILCLFNLLGI